MSDYTWVGLMAGSITSLAVVPQLIKTWRTKHARDLSFWQQVILIIGMFLWLIYGIVLNDTPLIAANAFSLFCYGGLLTLKIIYDRADKQRFNDYVD